MKKSSDFAIEKRIIKENVEKIHVEKALTVLSFKKAARAWLIALFLKQKRDDSSYIIEVNTT